MQLLVMLLSLRGRERRDHRLRRAASCDLFRHRCPCMLLPDGLDGRAGRLAAFGAGARSSSAGCMRSPTRRGATARSSRSPVRLRFENEDLIARLRWRKAHCRGAEHRQSRASSRAASHDLRQPVHALMLFVAALRRASPIRRRTVCSITSTVPSRPWAGCSTDLLRHLAPRRGRGRGERADFRAAAAARAHLPRLRRRRAGEANSSCSCGRPRAAVYSDPLLVERIVRNIVANAIAYTDRAVACSSPAARRGRIGAPCRSGTPAAAFRESEQREIFTEFYQVAKSRSAIAASGVGSGLAIVKRLDGLVGSSVADCRRAPDQRLGVHARAAAVRMRRSAVAAGEREEPGRTARVGADTRGRRRSDHPDGDEEPARGLGLQGHRRRFLR